MQNLPKKKASSFGNLFVYLPIQKKTQYIVYTETTSFANIHMIFNYGTHFIPCYSLGVGKLAQKKSFAKSKITSDPQNQFVYNIWQGMQVLHKFTYSTLKHNKIHWSLLGFCWLASLQKYEQCVGKVVQIRSSKCSFLRVAQCLDRWNSAVEWHWPDFLETNLLAFWSVLFVQQASLWHMVNWTVDSHHRLH